jgi:multiple sugar transport system substrate-binding protein
MENKKIWYIVGGVAGFLVLVILGMIMFSGGPGGDTGPQGDVELVMWKTFEDSEKLQPLINAYQEQHRNVRITYFKKNVERYEQDLLNALASGQGPDIFSINNSWLPEYVDKIEPVPEKLMSMKSYKESFVDVVAHDFTKDNKIYGVALNVDSLALYYNKDLLGTAGIATPPRTWEELESQVRRIKRQNRLGYFDRSGVAMGTNTNVNRSVDILYLLMLQQGVVPYDPDGVSPQFSQSIEKNGNYLNPGETALSFYTSFANPTTENYNWNARSDYSIDAFAAGKAAFLYSYPYTRLTLEQKSPNLNYGIAAVPQPNLNDPAVNFANYWGEVVSKQSKNAAVAWDFLKFISSKEALDTYYATDKKASSRKDLVELQIEDEDIGVFSHANLTAKSFYKPDQARIDSIFGQMIDNVILKGISVQESLSQAEQQASTITRE